MKKNDGFTCFLREIMGNFANRYRFGFTLQKNEGRTVRTDKNYNNRKMKKVNGL